MQATTASEFVEWNAYLDRQWTESSKEDHYMAQIAAAVIKANSKRPGSVKIQDFLLKFTVDGAEDEADVPLEEAKGFWFGVLGVKGV